MRTMIAAALTALAALLVVGCAEREAVPPPPVPASERIRNFQPTPTTAPATPNESYCGTMFARPWC